MTAFERIRDSWVPIWLKGFERKSRDYNSTDGWEPHTVLGVRGQFADIWRKVGKLKKSLWDGDQLEGEQPLEIIDDLISHLFLTRDMLLQEERARHTTGPKYLRAVTGHGYDGCQICVDARENNPGLIV